MVPGAYTIINITLIITASTVGKYAVHRCIPAETKRRSMKPNRKLKYEPQLNHGFLEEDNINIAAQPKVLPSGFQTKLVSTLHNSTLDFRLFFSFGLQPHLCRTVCDHR